MAFPLRISLLDTRAIVGRRQRGFKGFSRPIERLDLTTYEQAKEMLEAIEEEEEDFSDNWSENSRGRGQPQKSGGYAQERNRKQQKKSRAKAHVELAEQWPVFKGRGLNASAASRLHGASGPDGSSSAPTRPLDRRAAQALGTRNR